MKESFYFTHDYNTRSDDRIKPLIRRHGMLGYGIFWVLIEDLYCNANALRMDCDGIAYDLRTDATVVKSVIEDFDLFVIKDGFFGSLSVERRLAERDAKSRKASKSASLRWSQCEPHAIASQNDADALQGDEDSNAIKERKEKERKEKERKGEKENDRTPFELFLIDNGIYNSNTFEFLSSEMWFEAKAMQLPSELESLKEKAKEFLLDLRDRDMIEGKILNDFRAHFVSWFKKKRETVSENKPKFLIPEL